MKGQGKLHDRLVRALGALCALVFAVLVIDVLVGVLVRLGGVSAAWTQELATFLLVWLALLGGVLAYADEGHLGVDALVSRLHPDARRVARGVSHLCVFGFSLAVLVIGGGELFRDRWESGQMMTALPIRKAWFYLVLPLGGGLVTLLAAGKVIAALAPRSGKEESP